MNYCKYLRSASCWFLLLTLPSAFGGEPVRLSTDGTNKRDPVFTDGGRTLVYGIDDGPDLIRLMRMDLATQTVTPFFEDAGNKHNLEPAFSPDDRFVAFTQCTGNLTARLVIRDQKRTPSRL